MGADAHAGAAGLARDGIANAGVENDVTVEVADCLEWSPSQTVSRHLNPPWDGRLEGADAWTALRVSSREAGGGVAHLLTGNMPVTAEPDDARLKKKKLSTGGVELQCLT